MIKKFTCQEEVVEYFSHDEIQCLICGKWYKSLSRHISAIHGTNVKEYKDTFNLPYQSKLAGKITKSRQRKALLKRIAKGDSGLMPIKKIAHLGQQAKHTFRDFTKKRFSKNISQYNEKTRNASREKMEKYVAYLEKHQLRPYNIRGKEKSLGIITYNTFKSNCAYSDLHDDLYKRLQEIPSTKRYTPAQRIPLKDAALKFRNEGASFGEIAKKLNIPKATVHRIIKSKGVWNF